MKPLSRRTFLHLAGGMALASTVPFHPAALGGMLGKIFSKPARPTPAITPNDEFYVTSYRSPPTIRVSQWELSLRGMVDHPRVWTYPQLLEYQTVSHIITLECVGNTVGGEFISTAKWEGIPLAYLLQEAGVSSSAHDIVFFGADGYSDSITLDRALHGDVLLVHRMNGVPLPQGHGFPARIIVPGIYGMKSVQWITEIEVVRKDYKGYYQKKGWSDEAVVKTMSRIDVPEHGALLRGREYSIQGIAYAGTRGIQRVELSMDEGKTWLPATLHEAQSPYSWVFWSFQWRIPSTGFQTVKVRAWDGQGNVQTGEEQDPAPDGASGLHTVTVSTQIV